MDRFVVLGMELFEGRHVSTPAESRDLSKLLGVADAGHNGCQGYGLTAVMWMRHNSSLSLDRVASPVEDEELFRVVPRERADAAVLIGRAA
jgi:hypothetical protein